MSLLSNYFENKKRETIINSLQKKNNYNSFSKATEKMLGSEDFILKCVAVDNLVLSYCDETLLSNEDFILKCFDINNATLYYCNKSLLSNKDFILKCVDIDKSALYHCDKTLLSNEDFMLKCIAIDNFALYDCDKSLLSNEDFMLKSIEIDKSAFYHCDQTLLANKEFMLKYTNTTDDIYSCLLNANEQLKNNADFMLEIAKISNGTFTNWISFCSDELKNSPDFLQSVITAIENNEISEIPYDFIDILEKEPELSIIIIENMNLDFNKYPTFLQNIILQNDTLYEKYEDSLMFKGSINGLTKIDIKKAASTLEQNAWNAPNDKKQPSSCVFINESGKAIVICGDVIEPYHESFTADHSIYYLDNYQDLAKKTYDYTLLRTASGQKDLIDLNEFLKDNFIGTTYRYDSNNISNAVTLYEKEVNLEKEKAFDTIIENPLFKNKQAVKNQNIHKRKGR